MIGLAADGVGWDVSVVAVGVKKGRGERGGDVPFVHGTGSMFEVRSCQI